MQYTKPNFKYAEPLAGNDDIENLQSMGIEYMAKMANEGSELFQASIQRLVNSGLIPGGNY